MKLKLKPQTIVDNIPSEEDLCDMSATECIYAIRALTAAIRIGGDMVLDLEPNEHGQIFIKEFDIGLSSNEYEEVFEGPFTIATG